MFIVFEGGEGSGKSTQAHLLSQKFKREGIPFILTREPGDSQVGEDIRRVLLDRDRAPMASKTQTLLFAADKAEHIEKVVAPALARGEVVICDRYVASCVAYQSYGEGLPRGEVREVLDWATNGLYPDLTIYLDVVPELGLQRACRVNKTRFEDKDLDFHYRVSNGFMQQIDSTWMVVDGSDPIVTISLHIEEQVLKMYKLKQEARRVVESVYENSLKTVVEQMRILGFDEDEIERIRDKVQCPTCQGSSRETKGMVCQTCGRDYSGGASVRSSTPGCPNGHGELRVPGKF